MAEDREKIRQRSKAWYLANRERMLRLRSDRHAKNKEAENAYSKTYFKTYREKNRDRWLAYQKKWREANKASRLALNHKHNALKRGAGGSHTPADVAAIWMRQKHKCAVKSCTHPISENGRDKFQLDHVKALANGGSNDKDNLQILCRFHNSQKHAKDEYEWAQSHGMLFPK